MAMKNLNERIAEHKKVVAGLQDKHAQRLQYIADDLQHRRDTIDAQQLRAHANSLDSIEIKIDVAKALVQELELLAVCMPHLKAGEYGSP